MPDPDPAVQKLELALDWALGGAARIGRGALDGATLLGREALGGASQLGRALTTALRPAGIGRTTAGVLDLPGAPPGIEHLPDIDVRPPAESVQIRVMDYSLERVEERDIPVEEFEAFLAEPRPEWVQTRWLDLDGLHPWVVERVRAAFGIHPLAAEDVLHVPQRPGVDPYEDHVFVKTRVLMLMKDKLFSEQVSMFLFHGTLVTIQEEPGDAWDLVRDRIRRDGTRMRRGGADFLLYALLDAAVDHGFPLLERYGEVLAGLEERVLTAKDSRILVAIQRLRRELVAIRRVLWPTREMVDALARQELPHMTDETQVFLRDVYSHAVQLLEIVEAQRETCAGLSDLHMSMLSNRMNEVMKVLTIMASLFIPVTFLAGVYGMNFEHIPELKWEWSYPTFWGICIVTIVTLLVFFKRRGWL